MSADLVDQRSLSEFHATQQLFPGLAVLLRCWILKISMLRRMKLILVSFVWINELKTSQGSTGIPTSDCCCSRWKLLRSGMPCVVSWNSFTECSHKNASDSINCTFNYAWNDGYCGAYIHHHKTVNSCGTKALFLYLVLTARIWPV